MEVSIVEVLYRHSLVVIVQQIITEITQISMAISLMIHFLMLMLVIHIALLPSPCIDAGDPNSTYDADSSIADMGAFPSVFYGCIDSTALNYDSTATVDDGSCCLFSDVQIHLHSTMI